MYEFMLTEHVGQEPFRTLYSPFRTPYTINAAYETSIAMIHM
jgi:hypothetical protein